MRPYFKYSGDQLEKLFSESKNDHETLTQLLEELSHRSTHKMVNLRDRVQAHLQNFSKQSETTSGQSSADTSSQTKSQTEAPNKGAGGHGAGKGREKKRSQEYHEPYEEEFTYPKTSTASIRPSGNFTGVPSKFVFSLKHNVKLNLDNPSLLNRYEQGLKALIQEMRKAGTGTKQVALEKGVRIKIDGHNFGYEFIFDGEADLFEGASVEAVIGSTRCEGQIAAVFGKKLILGLSDDLGEFIESCVLRVDNTAMLEALRKRLEKIGNNEESGFNQKLAGAVVENLGDEEHPGHLPPEYLEGLNSKQAEAVSKIVTNPVYYLWGPPGTGKTQTLSVVSLAFFESGKKILLCSNTNQAVDQVLLKLCKRFGREHEAMEEGQIVRVGKINLPELENDWSDYVTLDGIVARKSSELNTQKEKFEADLERINQQTKKLQALQRRFTELDNAASMVKKTHQNLLELRGQVQASSKRRDKLRETLYSLNEEYEKVLAGGLLRFFRRSKEVVLKEKNETKVALASADDEFADLKEKMQDVTRHYTDMQTEYEKINESLEQYDRGEFNKKVQEVEDRKQAITQKIAVINRQLEDIAKSVVSNAKIIGATVTKAFLSPQMFSGFDVVIIDEASMVMLPALFHAAGLAKEKVVVSGDFRQLSPIVQTQEQDIFEAVGGDIFQTSKLVEAFGSGQRLKRTVMLDEQYRMDDKICKLISRRMYANKLITAQGKQYKPKSLPEPFNGQLIIVDTSTVNPFTSRDVFNSRYNLIHSLAIRNLCLYLRQYDLLEDNSVGVCTPYAAQARLLKKVLEGSDLDRIDAGTVHRFQGDEKPIIILDIPDSLGEYYAGIFLQANIPEDDGAKLFNVAVSRAQNHLIILANLEFLDKKLPNHAILRDILADIQDQGVVVDVRDVLKLWPIAEDLRLYGRAFDLSPNAEETGLYNQHDFELVCQADMAKARHSIVIFSGFITEQRVAHYESLFRVKAAEGVKIRCITRPPHRNGSIPVESGEAALDALESMGCVVDTRGQIHEKVVIIDGHISWFGSLNPLSHTAKTAEVMARIDSSKIALQIAAFLAVSRQNSHSETIEYFLEKESPDCPECNGRVTYMVGKYGPFWECDDCKWHESMFKGKAGIKTGERTKEYGPQCPQCGSRTVRRAGKYGDFFGCSAYPDCKYTIKA